MLKPQKVNRGIYSAMLSVNVQPQHCSWTVSMSTVFFLHGCGTVTVHRPRLNVVSRERKNNFYTELGLCILLPISLGLSVQSGHWKSLGPLLWRAEQRWIFFHILVLLGCSPAQEGSLSSGQRFKPHHWFNTSVDLVVFFYPELWEETFSFGSIKYLLRCNEKLHHSYGHSCTASSI